MSPFDNGKTHKEGVSRTYKGTDGYAPMMGYLGQAGYALAFELREGKQHSQKDTPAFLVQCLRDGQAIMDVSLFHGHHSKYRRAPPRMRTPSFGAFWSKVGARCRVPKHGLRRRVQTLPPSCYCRDLNLRELTPPSAL